MNHVVSIENQPRLYKTLQDGKSCHGGDHQWSLPNAEGPGEWQEVVGDLVRCENGFHLTTHPKYRWGGTNEIYEVEVDISAGILVPNARSNSRRDYGDYDSDEWVARRVRLARRIIGDELIDLLRTVKLLSTKPDKLYAVLEDAIDHGTKFAWPVPSAGNPGDWAEWKGEDRCSEIVQSHDGLHITDNPNRGYRVSCDVWEVEVDGDIWSTDDENNLRVKRARLLRRLPAAELDKLGVGVDRTYRRRPTWNWRRYDTIRKREPDGASPGERFVRLMAEHGDVSTSRDIEENENRFVCEALSLAIKGGLEFKGPDIFVDIGNPDGYYTDAVDAGNDSACMAIEEAIGRKPWFWMGKRIHAHSEFQWRGHSVKVTSFDDTNNQIVACAYKNGVRTKWEGSSYEREETRRTVAKRFVIEHAEFDDAAKRYKTYHGANESKKSTAEWFSKSRNGTLNIASLWFLSKEQRAELVEWMHQRKDAKRNMKSRVGSDPTPEFVMQAIADEDADKQERADIGTQTLTAIGPMPISSEDFKNGWEYEQARNVWLAKRDAFVLPLLAARATTIGRLERALRAWSEANFAGQPIDHLEAGTTAKKKPRKPSPTA
jgi:hypothetical protein